MEEVEEDAKLRKEIRRSARRAAMATPWSPPGEVSGQGGGGSSEQRSNAGVAWPWADAIASRECDGDVPLARARDGAVSRCDDDAEERGLGFK